MQRERAMRTLKIFAVAATLLVVIPAVAQEMGGGPIGPGSDRGLQPSYHGGYYYNGYWSDAFWPDRFGGGPISGAVGTAGAIAASPFVGLGSDGRYALAPRANHAYCAQHYRSYDPASATYIGPDGRRHPCR